MDRYDLGLNTGSARQGQQPAARDHDDRLTSRAQRS
jgi:hypothetical protein